MLTKCKDFRKEALASAEELLSEETRFIHELPSRQKIPLYDNFCYALALKKNGKKVEAQSLVRRLLAFEVDGAFPTYIHEYPQVLDRTLGAHLLPLLKMIGDLDDLIERIEKRLGDLPARARIKVTGELEGFTPKCPYEWADYLIAWQMERSSDAPLLPLIWNAKLAAYVECEKQPLQLGYEPKPTLLDFFLGSLYGQTPARALRDLQLTLRSVIVKPADLMVGDEQPPIHIAGEALRIFWGDREHVHTLYCPQQATREGDTWSFELDEDEAEEDVSLYINRNAVKAFTVDGERASCFRAGDIAEIECEGLTLRISFEGDGEFMAHFRPGNRPGQCADETRFNAYDWQVAFRTVKRPAQSQLRIKVTAE